MYMKSVIMCINFYFNDEKITGNINIHNNVANNHELKYTFAMFSVYTWQKDCLHNNNKTLITLYLHYIFIYMYTVPACQNERVTCSFNLNKKI